MNKRILSLLLALAMVVGMTVPAVYADDVETKTPAQIGSEIAAAANAIQFPENGGSFKADCPACDKEVTWTPLTSSVDNSGYTHLYAATAGGHYYLDQSWDITGALVANRGVCVHLNGKNIRSAVNTIRIAGGTLNLFGNGTITSNGYAALEFVNADTIANIYGGSFESVSATTLIRMEKKATVNMYDGVLDGKKIEVTNDPGVLFLNSADAKFNMYGGTIQNGKTTANGGNIRIMAGEFNMYGGLITGGVSTKSNVSTAEPNNVGGGNVLVQGASAKLNVYAGTISAGEARSSGGNILVSYGAKVTLDSGAIISGGKATGAKAGTSGGGNVYVHATGSMVTKAGSQIYGGTASNGLGYEIAATEGASFEIGGTVGSANKNTQTKNIYLQTGTSAAQAKIIVNGGTIYGEIDSVRSAIVFNDGVMDGAFNLRGNTPNATATVKHGTFSFNPTSYLSGAQAYAGENSTWSVHQPEEKEATSANCTEAGLLAHSGCAVCDLVWDAENSQWLTREAANVIGEAAHTRTLVEEIPATCTAAGTKAYYTCSCGEHYEDAEATTKIPDLEAWKTDDGAIAVAEHAYVYGYLSATEHTVVCANCETPFANGTHDTATADCDKCPGKKVAGTILRTRPVENWANTVWGGQPYQVVAVATSGIVTNENYTKLELEWYHGDQLLLTSRIQGSFAQVEVVLSDRTDGTWVTTFEEGVTLSDANIPTKMVLYVDGVKTSTYDAKGYNGTIFFDEASLKAYLQMSGSGHVHTLDEGVDSATCTAGGVLTQTCSVCDATVETPTAAKGHDYDPETGICQNGCGNTACQNGEHTWTPVEAKAATCMETGYEAHFTCTCGVYAQGEEKTLINFADIVTEKDMNNHVGESVLDPETVVQATCTSGGYTGDKKCSACGNVTEQGQATDPAPHAWTAKEAKAATCVATGNIAYYDCDNCDAYAVGEEKIITAWADIVTEMDMNNHAGDSVLDPETVVQATCTSGGYTGDEKCSACGNVTVKGQATVALEHYYDYTDNGDGTHNGVCRNNAEHVITNEEHTFVAGVCDKCGALEHVAATVNGTPYTTVEAALEAAQSGDQVVIFGSYAVEGTQTWNMTGITVTFAEAPADNYSLVVKGDLTIEGGEFVFQGAYGMGVTGKLTVTGGEFVGQGTNDYILGNWGTTVIEGGEFNGIYNCVNNFAGTTEIKDGSFTTEAYDCTGEYESEDILADSGLTVSGGTFSKPVAEEYCAEGFIPAENNGSYGVKVDDSQAKFNGQYYTSLEDALKAAKDNGGGVVLLSKDVEVTELTVLNTVTLDLNGNKLIMTGTTDYISAYYTNSFIIDTSAGRTGRVVADIDRLYLNDENGYLPVKMGDGIMFVQAAPGQVKKADKDYQCWIADGADDALINALKSGKTASELGLSFQVILTWGEGSNALKYTFRDTTVAQYMEDWQGNAMYLRIKGGENVTDLKYQSRIVFADGTDAEVVLWASNPVG